MNSIIVTEIKKEKKCINCLNCKVSAISPKNSRICFCAKRKETEYEDEIYWQNKIACKKFEDMD